MLRFMDQRRSVWLLPTKSRSNACAVSFLVGSTERSAIFKERILRAVSTYNTPKPSHPPVQELTHEHCTLRIVYRPFWKRKNTLR